MKFLVALAAFAVGASAAAAPEATSECLADYIVTTCLGTEKDKVNPPLLLLQSPLFWIQLTRNFLARRLRRYRLRLPVRRQGGYRHVRYPS